MSSLITSAIIAKETLVRFESTNVIANLCDWSYSNEFAKPTEKIGSTYNLRKPVLTTATKNNLAWVAANSAVQDNTVQIVVDRTIMVPMSFTEGDMALKVSRFAERYVQPVVDQVAASLDSDVADAIINSATPAANANAGLNPNGLATISSVPNAAGYVVGTYGTALNTATVMLAKKILLDQLCPIGDIVGVLSTDAQSQLNQAQATIFNPLLNVSGTYKKGQIGEFAGIKFYASTNLASHTNGTNTTLAITAAAGNTISSGWAETATLTVTATAGAVRAGDMYTVPGVFLVNPLTRVPTTNLFQFQVVTAANAGATSIVVSPAPISGGQYQNISATVASISATLIGAAGGNTNSSGVESLLFHKKAIQLVSPPFTLPKASSKDMVESISDPDDVEGFKLRYIREYDSLGVSGAFGGGVGTGAPGWVSRLDGMYGIKVSNPAWVVRIRS